MSTPIDLFSFLQASGLDEPLIRDHFARMPEGYFLRYPAEAVRDHIAMIARLDTGNLVEVRTEALGIREWRVTVVGFDYMAEMSIISGLMAAGGLSIVDGDVFTYREATVAVAQPETLRRPMGFHRRPRRTPTSATGPNAPVSLNRRKIVDLFHVRAVTPQPPDWTLFEQELENAIRFLSMDRVEEARTRINLRVVDYLRQTGQGGTQPLFPIHIAIDNTVTPDATLLRIEGQDTPAFLYALSTALALRGINIVRIHIETQGEDVRDTLEVTDRTGHPISDPGRIAELRFVIALIKQFTHLLTQAPNPAQALDHFNHLIDQVLANVRSERELEATFRHLEKQRVAGAMARLFGTSDFLWEDFLRMQHKNLFPVLQDIDAVGIRKSRERMAAELRARLTRVSGYERRKGMINRYKDREMFRIDMREILSDQENFRVFSQQLTDLAEIVLNAVFEVCDEELKKKYGQPVRADGAPCGFCLCALGKCGGREMGWASDIEMMFVYEEQGVTPGPHRVEHSEYFERLARVICDTVVARRAGIFEIDLRLRPYGDKGALASSLEMFVRYFNEQGGALPYERQALIKLRVIGGDETLGRKIEASRDAFVFSAVPLDLTALARLRERQNDELVGPGAINVKYSYGGVIDIEYYVQELQILYGKNASAVRSPNTLDALAALYQIGRLSETDYRMLSEAYTFLRRLINALRIVRGNAKDLVLPERDSQAFRFLARRLGYRESPDHDPSESLWHDIRRYMEQAAQTHRTRFGSDRPA